MAHGGLADHRAIKVPTPLVPGGDPLHPAEVAMLYADNLPDRRVVPHDASLAGEIANFCGQCLTK